MPRRRMIDPNIWRDPEVAKLNDAQKLLFIGMFSNADDEGRLLGTPESLKADIFPYDHKKTASVVKKLRDSIVTPLKNRGGQEKNSPILSRPPLKNVILYEIDGVEYIQFLRWNRYQSPKHFKPSILPKPPIESFVGGQTLKEPLGETSRETLGETQKETRSSPSIGKVRLDKVINLTGFSALKEEITKSKNKVATLVEFFTAYHAHAPPEDFENLGGRLAGILKSVSNDYLYLAKEIWDTKSTEIAGSHLNYIQGKIRGKREKFKKRSRELPKEYTTPEEYRRQYQGNDD